MPWTALVALLSWPALVSSLALRVPSSPDDMVARAADAVRAARAAGKTRLIVSLVVPTDPEFDQPADLDPWPGGLKQQYPIALELARAMLQRVVGCEATAVADQVVDGEDACGLLTAQAASAADDVACLLFPGCDQLGALEQMDATAGGRALVLVNPQFRRAADFSPWQREQAARAFFGVGYETAYAFEEFACRGEDVKLVGSAVDGWRAFAFLSDADAEGAPLFGGEPLPERPAYAALEREINRAVPKPRWARKLDEVDEKGLNFRRRGP